jgi:universal stress protein A
MLPIRHILCPIDFTAVSDRELKLAVELANRLHAGLVLQHNLASGAALGVSWMHEREHHDTTEASEKATRDRLKRLLDGLPQRVRHSSSAAITYGPLHHCVENLAVQAKADLIVIGTHGRTSADHASETDRLIRRAPCPVLTTRNDAPDEWLVPLTDTPAPIPTVVPVDFSAHSIAALRYALGLSHVLPLRLTALFVRDRAGVGAEWAESELAKSFTPEERRRFALDIRPGKPIDEILAEEAELHARLVVMGAHVAGWVERLLLAKGSTSREMLYKSPCPVWFVPAIAA